MGSIPTLKNKRWLIDDVCVLCVSFVIFFYYL